jgi:predicted RNase H-like HicB family nuclease
MLERSAGKLARCVLRGRGECESSLLPGAGGNEMKASIVIEKDEHGYYAFCPEMKGCHSQGESLDDVLVNIREAIELYLETLSEEEKASCLSKEILTTSLEVNVA